MTGQHCENCDGKQFTVTREMFTTVARDQSLQLKVAWCCGWNVSAFFTSQPQLLCLRGYYSTVKGSLCVEWTMMNNEPWIKLETLGNEWRNMSTWIDESSKLSLNIFSCVKKLERLLRMSGLISTFWGSPILGREESLSPSKSCLQLSPGSHSFRSFVSSSAYL